MTGAVVSPIGVVATPGAAVGRAVPADQGWVVRIMQQEGRGILRVLWRLLGREADVLDAYQDCFCKLASREARLSPRRAKAYVYRTAANIAIDMLRARSRHEMHKPAVAARRAAMQDADRHEPDEDHTRRERLRGAIAQLPTHLRNVIVLRDLGRQPYAVVAKTLGLDPATARVYRRHAVVRLAEMMQGESS